MKGSMVYICAVMMVLTLPLPVGGHPEGGGGITASAEWNTIRGYVRENATNTPIAGAYVVLQADNSGVNYTLTNASGYYEMLAADGSYQVMGLHGRYMFAFTTTVVSGKGERWVNLTLVPAPSRDSLVRGYVNDSMSGGPLPNLDMVALRPPQSMPDYANISVTNASGYFEMYVLPGSYDLFPTRSTDHYANGTGFSVLSGQTVWVNLSLDPILFKGTIRGYIRENGTAAPIPGGRIGAYEPGGYANYSLTDTSGYYELNMTPGTVDIRATAFRYSEDTTRLNLTQGGSVWLNFTLDPLNQTAVLRGYVMDNVTGTPLPNTYVELRNQSYSNSTSTNASGLYEIYGNGGTYQIFMYSPGHLMYFGSVDLVDGSVIWLNVSLDPAPPENSVVRGIITDALTSQVIPGANIEVTNRKNWFNSTGTDPSGYYSVNTIADHIYLRASMNGYFSNSSDFDIADGQVRWVNLSLYPMLPQNVTLRGYINDSFSSVPIPNAKVQVSGYRNQTNESFTNGSGYYEMMVYPVNQTVFVSAPQYGTNITSISPTGGTLWLNMSLEPDTTPPMLTPMTLSPDANVSVNRPTNINGSLSEKYLEQDLVYLAEHRNGTGTIRNYTSRLVYSSVDDPDAFPVPTRRMVLTPKGGNGYDWRFTWNATTEGAMLGNASGREFVGVLYSQWSNEPIILGMYKNASMPSPLVAIAFFDAVSGAFERAIVDPGGLDEQVTASSDPSGEFGALDLVWTVDIQGKWITGASITEGPRYSIRDVDILPRERVASGEYAVIEFASDYGDNTNITVEFLTVDNDPPKADAGPDISTYAGETVTFNGSGSSDNVGVSNYTWTFFDGTANRTLYGPAPAHNFSTAGTYNVTLTVTDGANNTDTDTMSVNVTPPPGHISGKVLSGPTPISGASVRAYLAGTTTIADQTTTDANGNYNLTGLIEGERYDINASASGYIPAQMSGVQANASAVDFDLKRVSVPGHISGKVLSGPTPISGASVRAYLAGTTTIADQTTTDANGNYNLTGLIEGERYDINASASGYIPAQMSGVQANASAVDFDLKRVPQPSGKGWITGEVWSKNGDALPQVDISILANGSEVTSTTTDASGRFNVSVDPGRYDVRASRTGYNEETRSGVVVHAGRETHIATIVLVRQSEVEPGPDLFLYGMIAALVVIVAVLVGFAVLYARKRGGEPSEEKEKKEKEGGEEEGTKPPEGERTGSGEEEGTPKEKG